MVSSRGTVAFVELRDLSDEALVELLESSPDDDALEELFRRIRAEAKPEKRAYVEAVIARLRSSFAPEDDEDGPGTAGVREPRRPSPQAGSAAA